MGGAYVRSIRVNDIVCGVACSDTVIAAGTLSRFSQIALFDLLTGNPLISFGPYGSEPGQVSSPVGMRFTPSGDHIVVAEIGNNRLSVFTCAGVHTVSSPPDLLFRPTDVQFAPNGDALVCDSDHHRVCVCSLSPLGIQCVRWFEGNGKGVGPGQFLSPNALAIDMQGRLLVLEFHGSARVQVFA